MWCLSRGEAEGADSDCQGTPGPARQEIQPHQPGAQSAGQKTEEGKIDSQLSTFYHSGCNV